MRNKEVKMAGIFLYPKVLTLGSAYTENALEGKVVVQEKYDGSQIRWGINQDGIFEVCSRRRKIPIEQPGQFKKGIEYLMEAYEEIKPLPPLIMFFGEYLQKPKHNVLKYERIPKNHIVLFDALVDGNYVNREDLERWAEVWGIEAAVELFRGDATIDILRDLLKGNASSLGKEDIEGVVIKNYDQQIVLGGVVRPLFTKLVQSKYRERKQVADKKARGMGIERFILSFRNENRWQKALQYLKDEGKLANEPKDIGLLIKRIHKDIEEEETENIRNFLLKKVIKKIKAVSSSGVAEWYKDKLIERLKKEER